MVNGEARGEEAHPNCPARLVRILYLLFELCVVIGYRQSPLSPFKIDTDGLGLEKTHIGFLMVKLHDRVARIEPGAELLLLNEDSGDLSFLEKLGVQCLRVNFERDVEKEESESVVVFWELAWRELL